MYRHIMLYPCMSHEQLRTRRKDTAQFNVGDNYTTYNSSHDNKINMSSLCGNHGKYNQSYSSNGVLRIFPAVVYLEA